MDNSFLETLNSFSKIELASDLFKPVTTTNNPSYKKYYSKLFF